MMFYRGKRARKRALARPVLLALSLVLVLGLSVGGTLAYLVTNTDPVTNTFTPGKLDTPPKETFENDVKSDVVVTNSNDSAVAAYVRATWTINWVVGNGETAQIVAPAKAGEYEIDVAGTGSGWSQGSDGFYYWHKPVEPGEETGALIESLTANNEAAPKVDGVHLQATIITQTIQADPVDAIEDTGWPVRIDPVSGDLSVNS